MIRRLPVLLFFLLSIQLFAAEAVPTRPELQTPANQQTDYDDGVFGWKISTDSDGGPVVYDFYLGTSPANMTLVYGDIYNGLTDNDFFAFADGDILYFGSAGFSDNTTYYWKVVAKSSTGETAESDTWRYATSRVNLHAPDKPVGPNPFSGQVNVSQRALLEWTASQDADGDAVVYDLYLDTLAAPALVATDLASNGYKITGPLKGNKTYYWKIIASDGRGKKTAGDIWTFTTANTPPLPATLAVPADNAVNTAVNVTLEWNPSFDPDRDIEQYEVWYAVSGQSPVLLTTTDTHVSLSLNAGTSYEWYVTTTDLHGARVNSATHHFTTADDGSNQAPAAFSIIAPVDNSVDISTAFALAWTPAGDPDQDNVLYDVYLSTDQGRLARVATALTATTFTSQLLPATHYYTKIVAYDKKGGVTESMVIDFTTTSADVSITNIGIYYRYVYQPLKYEFLRATLGPAFSKYQSTYSTRGRSDMTDAVAIAFYHTSPTEITLDLPNGFTATSTIVDNYGLPTDAQVIYLIEGDFSGQTPITAHLVDGNAERSYTFDIQVNQLPEKPLLLTPANGAVNVSTKPVFTWSGGSDPDGTQTIYRIYAGLAPNKLNTLGFVYNTNTFAYTAGTLQSNAKYYWKVTAQDANSEVKESDVYAFVTARATGAPTIPVPAYPRAISNYVDTDVTLRWRYDPLKNASYDIYFDTQSTPKRVATNVTGETYTVTGLTNSTEYYWKVVARHPDGTASEGPLQKFRTKPLNGNETGVMTDTRDGQQYQWVKIGNAKWMVHNLAYEPNVADGYTGYQYYHDTFSGGKEYFILNQTTDTYSKYGYLYNWAGAINGQGNPNIAISRQGVCPSGWHIPTRTEWDALYIASGGAGGNEIVANNTLYHNTWTVSGKETTWLNRTGLSILPSGMKAGTTLFQGTYAQFWLADKDSSGGKFVQYNYNTSAKQLIIRISSADILGDAASVRCVESINRPPAKPVLKAPVLHAGGQGFNVRLEWYAGTDPEGDALEYIVYADTAKIPKVAIPGVVTQSFYDFKGLLQNTTYYWKVAVRDGNGNTVASDVWSFTTQTGGGNTPPAAPSLLLPANQSTIGVTAAAFGWAPLTDTNGDVVTADLYYGVRPDALQLVAANLTGTSYTSPVPLASSTTYYWKLVAKDGHGGVTHSAINQFSTINRAPAAPTLKAPANGAQNTLLQHVLTWQVSADPDGDKVTYSVYVGTSPSALTLYAGGLNTTSAEFGNSPVPQNTTHYWQVVATDTHGAQTASAIWSFKTYVYRDGATATTLVSPAAGATGVSMNPVLSWNAVAGRTYDVYILQGPWFVLAARDLTTTSFTITEWNGESHLAPHTSYLWQVVSKTATGGGVSPSSISTFTTMSTAPTKPLLTAPADLATGQAYNTQLQWTTSTDADGDPVAYDVLLGTTVDPSQVIATNLSAPSFTLPPYTVQPNTRYYWKIIAKDPFGSTTTSDIRSFTVQNNPVNSAPSAPLLLTPANYASGVGVRPVLFWQASQDIDGNAIVYDVYLSTSNTLTTPVATGITGLSYTVPTSLQTNRQYYWKVVARDGNGGTTASNVWSFTTLNTLPSTVTLTSPATGDVLTQSTATLTWAAATDADGDALVYDVYLDKTSQAAVAVARGLTALSFTTPTLDNNKVYYWRVIARDQYGEGLPSEVRTFTGKNDPPSAPVLQSPANNVVVSVMEPTLSWLAAVDADGSTQAYEILFGEDPTPTTRIATLYNSLSFSVPGLSAETTYYWKIRVKDEHGLTAESAVWKFQYKPGAVNQAPSAPVLLTPAHMSTDQPANPVLTWNSSTDPEGDPVRYQLYFSEDPGATVALASDLLTTSYSLSALKPGTTYYWKVVAQDDQANTTSSAIWQFTTAEQKPVLYSITGTIAEEQDDTPLAGIRVTGFPHAVQTDVNGVYYVEVPAGWSGEVVPVAEGRTFAPEKRIYTNVQQHYTAQHYTALLISGMETPGASVLTVYPNPTRGGVNILFSKAITTGAWVLITDTKGQEVLRLTVNPGVTSVSWNGADASGNVLPSGVYYAQLFSETGIDTVIRIMIIK